MLWLTLSKAFCKSIYMPQVKIPLSNADLIFSVISTNAWVVEWLFLKPNWRLKITLLLSRNEYNRVWMSFSMSLLMFEALTFVFFLIAFLLEHLYLEVFQLFGKTDQMSYQHFLCQVWMLCANWCFGDPVAILWDQIISLRSWFYSLYRK